MDEIYVGGAIYNLLKPCEKLRYIKLRQLQLDEAIAYENSIKKPLRKMRTIKRVRPRSPESTAEERTVSPNAMKAGSSKRTRSVSEDSDIKRNNGKKKLVYWKSEDRRRYWKSFEGSTIYSIEQLTSLKGQIQPTKSNNESDIQEFKTSSVNLNYVHSWIDSTLKPVVLLKDLYSDPTAESYLKEKWEQQNSLSDSSSNVNEDDTFEVVDSIEQSEEEDQNSHNESSNNEREEEENIFEPNQESHDKCYINLKFDEQHSTTEGDLNVSEPEQSWKVASPHTPEGPAPEYDEEPETFSSPVCKESTVEPESFQTLSDDDDDSQDIFPVEVDTTGNSKSDAYGSGPHIPECPAPKYDELTPDMEKVVDQALQTTGMVGDCLVKVAAEDLRRKDFQALGTLGWLNDSVINSYFNLIMERSKKEGYPSVFAYDTFFYSHYKRKGYARVKRSTRKIDIFNFDLNFVPIHSIGIHWCLAVIDHRSKKVSYYDSLGKGEINCLNLLHEYLCLEYEDKKDAILDCSYRTEVMKNIPHQLNGADCGMFVLKYAEYISRGAEITFTQEQMYYFRRKMIYELLTKELL